MQGPNFRDHRIFLIHLFRVLYRRGASVSADIHDEVADLAGITPAQRAIPSKDASWNPVHRNRIQFARQSLVDAGIVIGSSVHRFIGSSDPGWKRGVWELSAAGVKLGKADKSDSRLEALLRERAAEGMKQRAEQDGADRR